MQITDFDYDLPEELIANYPLKQRTDSRLLVVDPKTHSMVDTKFNAIETLLSPGDLLVLNNTKVIQARLFGQKSTGGKVELLVERLLDPHTVLAHVKSSKSPKAGTQLYFDQELIINVLDRSDDLFKLEFSSQRTVLEWLDLLGSMPLPPYIKRAEEIDDKTRYQTVYAKENGAVAAPTAGLHFDKALLQRLATRGIQSEFLTLHVGAGTFQPVRVDDINDHKMHAEFAVVNEDLCQKIRETKRAGNRVVAVGTTSVRALETAACDEQIIQPYIGETDIFIFPGYEFKVVDAIITNFHLPKSTLLMLVSAFIGHDVMKKAYQHAIENGYRFYSYGDAMLLGNLG